jgi:hypothetical protein
MALSDTCFEALETLQDGLVSYADDDYLPTHLSRIVTAIYEVGEFMVRQDIPPNSPPVNVQEILDGVVVANILDKAYAEKSVKICSVLADVARINSRLNQSIESMITELSSKERLFDVIKDPRLLDQLKEIKHLKDT